MKWKIEHDNDVGALDEAFWEWWEVTDSNRHFKCDEEVDAIWLCELLNNFRQDNLTKWREYVTKGEEAS